MSDCAFLAVMTVTVAAVTRLPLPGEVVAYVGVAVSGIVAQAPVKRKRVIKLVDPLARVIDGRRNASIKRLDNVAGTFSRADLIAPLYLMRVEVLFQHSPSTRGDN
jgi:hypothetical protein